MKKELKGGKMKGKTKSQRAKIFKAAVAKWNRTKGKGSKSKKGSPKPSSNPKPKNTGNKGGNTVSRRGFNQQKLFKIARLAAMIGPHAGVWLSAADPMEKAAESVALLSGFDMRTGQFNFQKLVQGYGPALATTAVTALIPKVNGLLKGFL